MTKNYTTRHSRLITSIMLCASALMLIAPTTNAFADNNADSQRVNASQQAIQQSQQQGKSSNTSQNLQQSQSQNQTKAQNAQQQVNKDQTKAKQIYTKPQSNTKKMTNSNTSNNDNHSLDSMNVAKQVHQQIKKQVGNKYSQTSHGIDAHELKQEEQKVTTQRHKVENYQAQVTQDKEALEQVSARQAHEVVPVPKQDETPLPNKQYTQYRTNVQNPMLLTNTQYRQYHQEFQQNGGHYKDIVPMTKATQPQQLNKVKPFKDFSLTVLRYKPYLDKVCKVYHMQNYEILMLGIMQNESNGKGQDVMQSSESAGLKPNSLNPQQSIEQAVKYMHSIVNKAHKMDEAEYKSPKLNARTYHHYATDDGLLAQTYNFGAHFLDYVSHSKEGYNVDVAQKYSKDVIAPRLGNKNGDTYAYNNPIAKAYGKKFLYKNGGNYLYGPLVEQYTVSGLARPLIKDLMQYVGKPYVFGGKTPQHGFDCSGIISYGLSKVFHMEFPSNTVAQWHNTEPVASVNDAKPGDLIFFKGTYGNKDFISHVEILVDRNTMFGSDGSGVGFHNIHEPYWEAHYAGVRRLPQAHKLNSLSQHQFNKQVKKAMLTLNK